LLVLAALTPAFSSTRSTSIKLVIIRRLFLVPLLPLAYDTVSSRAFIFERRILMKEEIGGVRVRMEEEEEEPGWSPRAPKTIRGFSKGEEQGEEDSLAAHSELTRSRADFIRSLAAQRDKILSDEKFSAKEKCNILEENRKAMIIASGGTIRTTDSVVYGILVFGGTVLIILALLTSFAGLPREVTVSFVGTVLGGVIATIAQKIGKL
jgi:hypothetical protein